MSLWWAKREQLDDHQRKLIEGLPLRSKALILGPPGSGKTNVLLRRAQFVRGQSMPSVLVLTFTRSLTEFVKTGCYDAQGREIFPKSCVMTLESWQRWLYSQHDVELPDGNDDLIRWKRSLSQGAFGFDARKRLPKYDALFVDEAQDLLAEEVELLRKWSDVLFFVGDDRQKIHDEAEGLDAIRKVINSLGEHSLPFHYRMAPEICEVADRIMQSQGGDKLTATEHYVGPKPGKVTIQRSQLSKEAQLNAISSKLREQIRVYADLIKQGDRLGVIVARKDDRQLVFEHLENDAALEGKSKIVRAKLDEDDDYDPTIDDDTPICIVTVKGCKGLEFRAVHWPFAEANSKYHGAEHYYTVVTRAKTSLDIYYTNTLPQILARAHAPAGVEPW